MYKITGRDDVGNVATTTAPTIEEAAAASDTMRGEGFTYVRIDPA